MVYMFGWLVVGESGWLVLVGAHISHVCCVQILSLLAGVGGHGLSLPEVGVVWLCMHGLPTIC